MIAGILPLDLRSLRENSRAGPLVLRRVARFDRDLDRFRHVTPSIEARSRRSALTRPRAPRQPGQTPKATPRAAHRAIIATEHATCNGNPPRIPATLLPISDRVAGWQGPATLRNRGPGPTASSMPPLPPRREWPGSQSPTSRIDSDTQKPTRDLPLDPHGPPGRIAKLGPPTFPRRTGLRPGSPSSANLGPRRIGKSRSPGSLPCPSHFEQETSRFREILC